jgi:hypothetical protein
MSESRTRKSDQSLSKSVMPPIAVCYVLLGQGILANRNRPYVASRANLGPTVSPATVLGGYGPLVGGRGPLGGRARRVTERQNAPRGPLHLYGTLHWGAHTEHSRPRSGPRALPVRLVRPVDLGFCGAPGRIRTCGHRMRRLCCSEARAPPGRQLMSPVPFLLRNRG